MCTRGGLLIAYVNEERKALLTDADCESWKCEECAKLLQERWQRRAKVGAHKLLEQGAKLQFVTLTSHEKVRDFTAGCAVWSFAWNKLQARLRRKSQISEYFMIPERHKSGALHMHALWTFNVSKRWLKDNARQCGLGYMVDVQPVESASGAVRYVTKYLAKSLGDDMPQRFRRVRVSVGWAKLPDVKSEQSDYVWEYIGGNGALNQHYRRCADEGITMIDIRTGEIWDDVDLGTIAWEN